jgi:hypothetical protein
MEDSGGVYLLSIAACKEDYHSLILDIMEGSVHGVNYSHYIWDVLGGLAVTCL